MRKVIFFLLASILMSIIVITDSNSYIASFDHDSSDRLTRVEIETESYTITYSYDHVGNRTFMNTQSPGLGKPDVMDTGQYSLDTITLVVDVSQYGDEYGNLTYEFAIGTSSGGNDIVDWTLLEIDENGRATITGLNLSYNQDYFVSVRVINFRGDIVSDIGSSDGITVVEIHPAFATNNIFHNWENAGDVTIAWESIYGASYDIYSKDDFSGSLSYVASVTATDGNASWFDDGSFTVSHPTEAAQRYYLVKHEDVEAMNTVGMFKITVYDGMNLISLPLIPFSNRLEDVIGSQVVGADNEGDADRIWVWSGTNYEFAWLIDGVGPTFDGKWYSGNQPTIITFDADQGAWIQVNPGHGPRDVFIVGEVSSGPRAVSVEVGMNLIGTCYPIPVPLTDTNLWESGLSGADNEGDADRIWAWGSNHYEFYWLVDGVGEPFDGQWYMGNQPVDISLEPGKGY